MAQDFFDNDIVRPDYRVIDTRPARNIHFNCLRNSLLKSLLVKLLLNTKSIRKRRFEFFSERLFFALNLPDNLFRYQRRPATSFVRAAPRWWWACPTRPVSLSTKLCTGGSDLSDHISTSVAGLYFS